MSIWLSSLFGSPTCSSALLAGKSGFSDVTDAFSDVFELFATLYVTCSFGPWGFWLTHAQFYLWQVSLALLMHLQVYWYCMHRPGRVCVLSASLGSLNASNQFPRPSGPAAPCLASSAHHPFLHPHPCSRNPTHKSCMHAHHTPCLPTHPHSRTHPPHSPVFTPAPAHPHQPLHQRRYRPLFTHPCLVIDHHHNTVMVSMTHHCTPTPLSEFFFFLTASALMTMAAMPSPNVDGCDQPPAQQYRS